MIGLVIAAAFVAAAATAAIARVVTGRAERKSVQSYERVLDTLGDVARRSDARAHVPFPEERDLALPHVRPQRSPDDSPADESELPHPPRVAPSIGVISSQTGPLVFVDDTYSRSSDSTVADSSSRRRRRIAGRTRAGVTEVPTTDAPAVGEPVPNDDADASPVELLPRVRTPAMSRSPVGSRQGLGGHVGVAARVAVAVVVLAGIGVGVWKVTGSKVSSTPRAPSHAAHHADTPKRTPNSTTVPTTFHPRTTTASVVSFDVPSGPLHISFAATGPCWLGVFHGAGSNPSYQWMDTLTSDQTASYDAKGTIYLRLGNPPAITVSVNGIPLALPSGNIQPYNVELIPS